MTKNKEIKKLFSYREGPYITHLIEKQDGTVEEMQEHYYNYARKLNAKTNKERDFESKKPLNKYTEYGEKQYRDTDVWNFAD